MKKKFKLITWLILTTVACSQVTVYGADELTEITESKPYSHHAQ